MLSFVFHASQSKLKHGKNSFVKSLYFNDEVKNFAFDLTISNCLFQKSERPNTFFGLSLG